MSLWNPPKFLGEFERMNICDITNMFIVTLLFMAYNFVAISLATNVVKTVARYASLTRRYSRADLCQNKYLHELAATIDTWSRNLNNHNILIQNMNRGTESELKYINFCKFILWTTSVMYENLSLILILISKIS